MKLSGNFVVLYCSKDTVYAIKNRLIRDLKVSVTYVHRTVHLCEFFCSEALVNIHQYLSNLQKDFPGITIDIRKEPYSLHASL